MRFDLYAFETFVNKINFPAKFSHTWNTTCTFKIIFYTNIFWKIKILQFFFLPHIIIIPTFISQIDESSYCFYASSDCNFPTIYKDLWNIPRCTCIFAPLHNRLILYIRNIKMAFTLPRSFDVGVFFNPANGILSTTSSLWLCPITETARLARHMIKYTGSINFRKYNVYNIIK